MDLSFLELEHLCKLPGPRRRRPGRDRAAVRRLVAARVAAHVIEEDEAEDEPALLVDGDVAPIANARHEVQESRLELFPATPLARVVAGGFRIGSRLAGGRRLVGRLGSVFEPIAVVGERIDALAV